MTLLDVIRHRERGVRAAHDALFLAADAWAVETSPERSVIQRHERAILAGRDGVLAAKGLLRAAEALRDEADATADRMCPCVTWPNDAHLSRRCPRAMADAPAEAST